MQVELNHTDPSVLPVGFRTDSNDSRILACALNLEAEGGDVVLVSKDIPLRVKAGAVGLPADEYHAHDVVPSGWTGMTELDVASSSIDELFSEGVVDLEEARELPCHTGIRLLGGSSSALGRVNADKRVQLVRGGSVRHSVCTDVRPSSGSPWTSCWTTVWASCRWAARRAPASRRWR